MCYSVGENRNAFLTNYYQQLVYNLYMNTTAKRGGRSYSANQEVDYGKS